MSEGGRRRGIVLAAVFFAVMPFAVQAQPKLDGPPVESVTVEAPKEARPTPFLTGGSRWMLAFCPTVLGLAPEQDKRVHDRLMHVAALVGAPHWNGVGRCSTNAEIVFTAQPQAFLDAVAENRYRLLGGSPNQAKAAARVRYPIQSWYSIAVMDEQGGLLLMPPDEEACDPYCFFHMGNDARPPRTVIGAVVIVVDINQAQNRTLTALSDYVALMALTQARAFARCQPAPSIANLMAADCAGDMQPDELTAGDIAWLRRLYHMSDERARRADEEELASSAQAKAGGGK